MEKSHLDKQRGHGRAELSCNSSRSSVRKYIGLMLNGKCGRTAAPHSDKIAHLLKRGSIYHTFPFYICHISVRSGVSSTFHSPPAAAYSPWRSTNISNMYVYRVTRVSAHSHCDHWLSDVNVCVVSGLDDGQFKFLLCSVAKKMKKKMVTKRNSDYNL